MSFPTRITFSHIINVIKTSGKKTHVPLGRWGIKSDRNSGLVADYSNEDHCGSCDYYIDKKNRNANINRYTKELLDVEYESMVNNTPN